MTTDAELRQHYANGGTVEIPPQGDGEIAVHVPGEEYPHLLNPGDSMDFDAQGAGEMYVDGESVFIPEGSTFEVIRGNPTFVPYDSSLDWDQRERIALSAADAEPLGAETAMDTTLYPNGGTVEIPSQGDGEIAVHVPGEEYPHLLNPGDAMDFDAQGAGEMYVDGEAAPIPEGTTFEILRGDATFVPYDPLLDWGDRDRVPLEASPIADVTAETPDISQYPEGGLVTIGPEGQGEVIMPDGELHVLEPGDTYDIMPGGAGEVVIDGMAHNVPEGSSLWIPQGGAEFIPFDDSIPFDDRERIDLGPGDYAHEFQQDAALEIPADVLASLGQEGLNGGVSVTADDLALVPGGKDTGGIELA